MHPLRGARNKPAAVVSRQTRDLTRLGLLYEVRISRILRNPLMNQSNKFSTCHDFTLPGMTKTVVHNAALLSPAEVALSFGRQWTKERELVHGHWLLAGAVNPTLFSALRIDAGREISGELGILCTPSGAAYSILCSQLGMRQHRHVLPLYDAKVVAFLSSAIREPFRMCMESAGLESECIYYTSPLTPDLFIPSYEQSQEIDLARRDEFILELPLLIAQVAKIEMMRSLKNVLVREVDVSFLVPED